jgi:peptidoglycan/LPS O-acetylase OafA/YrhL
MTFNRDIQCLRGISVLLIVFVHFGIFYSLLPLNLAQNGFIGVDLFFCISGFIITKSIFSIQLKEWKKDGSGGPESHEFNEANVF